MLYETCAPANMKRAKRRRRRQISAISLLSWALPALLAQTTASQAAERSGHRAMRSRKTVCSAPPPAARPSAAVRTGAVAPRREAASDPCGCTPPTPTTGETCLRRCTHESSHFSNECCENIDS